MLPESLERVVAKEPTSGERCTSETQQEECVATVDQQIVLLHYNQNTVI